MDFEQADYLLEMIDFGIWRKLVSKAVEEGLWTSVYLS